MSQHLSDELSLEPGLCTALDRLKLGDFQTRWEAAKTIPNFGPAATAPLLTILEEEETDWELLWFVARILGNLNEPSVVDALVRLLRTTDHTEVAGMAAIALTHYGVAAVAPLAELLQDESTRLLAVQALVQIRHPQVIPPLLSAVADPAAAIRSAAIESLSHFYAPAISAALLAALADLDSTVRRAAVVGLGMQAQQCGIPELVEPLRQRLWDFNLEVCCQAAIALGRVGTDEAADALFEVLRSDRTPSALQMEAIRALSRMDTVYGLNRLRACLQSEDAQPQRQKGESQESGVRSQESGEHPPIHPSTPPSPPSLQQEIIAVLGRVESAEVQEQAVKILLEVLSSQAPWLQETRTRQTIALSLGQLGQLPALEALIELLADANASVRFHAIAALKQLDADAAYQRLQMLASNDTLEPELQVGVTIALQEWRS